VPREINQDWHCRLRIEVNTLIVKDWMLEQKCVNCHGGSTIDAISASDLVLVRESGGAYEGYLGDVWKHIPLLDHTSIIFKYLEENTSVWCINCYVYLPYGGHFY